MKLITVLCMSLVFVSCGDKKVYIPHEIVREIRQDVVVEKTVVKSQDFEGFYVFENNSQIEIIAGSNGKVHIIKDNQILNTVNPENQTLGTFPRFEKTNLKIRNNEIFFTKDLKYDDGHDIEEDGDGSNIRGKKKTDFLIQKDGDGIKLTIFIYDNKNNSNINYITVKRIFKSL